MEIKKFCFPTFEIWNKTQKYEGKIGAYTCAIRAFSHGCNGNTKNEYVAAIAACDNPLSIYAKKEISDYIECDYFDEQRLKGWYDKVILTFNKQWENFILDTYFSE